MKGVSKPTRVGFGLKFIERTIVHDLDGTVDLTWDEDGFGCTIVALLDRVAFGADHE